MVQETGRATVSRPRWAICHHLLGLCTVSKPWRERPHAATAAALPRAPFPLRADTLLPCLFCSVAVCTTYGRLLRAHWRGARRHGGGGRRRRGRGRGQAAGRAQARQLFRRLPLGPLRGACNKTKKEKKKKKKETKRERKGNILTC